MKHLTASDPLAPAPDVEGAPDEGAAFSPGDLELLAAERVTALRSLIDGVAYELNSPLTLVLANADFVRRRLAELDEGLRARLGVHVTQAVDEAIAGARRIRDVVRSFRGMACGDALLGPVDVGECLDGLLDVAGSCVSHRARLERCDGAVPPVHASEARLRQVLLDLMTHAAAALPADGDAVVRIATERRIDGRVAVAVHASGPGPCAREVASLFEPRARGPFGGAGLAVCRSLAATFGAEVVAHARGDDGTTFEVLLHPAS